MNNKNLPKEGYRFEMYGNHYDITAVISGNVRFSSVKGGKIYNISLEDFIYKIDNHEFLYIETPYYPLLDKDNYAVISRKKRYIEAVLALQYMFSNHAVQDAIEEVASAINDQTPPCSRTVMRWVKKFNTAESFLNDFEPNKGNLSLRFSIEIENIINHGLNEYFLKPKEPRSAIDVRSYIINEFLLKGISTKPPSLRTIQRRIKKLDQYMVFRNKKGIRTANLHFRAAGKKLSSPFLMNKVEVDSHLLDIIILDDNSFEVIGRPTLTCAIDVFSRCIVGWHISMLPPNTNNTISLFKGMFTRPTENLPGGIPSYLVPDNGVEFQNNSLSSICENRKITIIPSQKYDPNNKPHIERFFKTFTESFIQKLKGTTYSNPSLRGEYNSNKNAGLTFSNIKYLINEWIESVYHQSPHDGIDNRIPIIFWNESLKTSPVLSMSKDEIDILARVPQIRTINNGRVQFCYLTYYSHVLMGEIENNTRVTIFIDETNLERIYIRNPKDKNSFIIAESTNPSYTKNLSLYEHECIRKQKKTIAEKDLQSLGEHADLYARWKLYSEIQTIYATNKKLKQLKLEVPMKIRSLLNESQNSGNIQIEVNNENHDPQIYTDTNEYYSTSTLDYPSFSTSPSIVDDKDNEYESMTI